MKRFLLVATLCALFASIGAARQTAGEAPATKEDIQEFFRVMHVRDTMKARMDEAAKESRLAVHNLIAKNAENLPADFEARANRMEDDLFKDWPVEELLQAVAPVYQKRLSKEDLDAIIAFYSTPRGQKLLKEMPAMTQEAMQAAYPVVQKKMNTLTEWVRQEIARAVKEPNSKPGQDSKASPNDGSSAQE